MRALLPAILFVIAITLFWIGIHRRDNLGFTLVVGSSCWLGFALYEFKEFWKAA